MCLCCVSVQLMTGARRVIMVLIRECSTHPHASHHPVQLISVLLELWLPLFPKIQSDKLLCSTRHGNYIEMLCNAGNTVNHNEPVFFSSMFMSVFQIVFFFLYFLLLLMLFVCLVYYLTIKYRAMRFQVEVVTTAVEFFCFFFSIFQSIEMMCFIDWCRMCSYFITTYRRHEQLHYLADAANLPNDIELASMMRCARF